MKRFWALLLVILLLLTGCAAMDFGEATPEKPTHTTPDGTEFNVPFFLEPEEETLVLTEEQITDELRQKYLDFCQQYRVNKLPAFDYYEGVVPSKEQALGYMDICLYNQYLWGYDEQDQEFATISGDVVNDFLRSRFGLSLGLKETDQVFYDKERWHYIYDDAFSYRYPMVELTDYAEAKCGDTKTIRIRGRGYAFEKIEGEGSKTNEYKPRINKPLSWDSHLVWEMMKETGMNYYQCAEKMIVTGQTEDLNPPLAMIELCYMEGEGGEPLFLSYSATPVDQSNNHLPVEYIPEE